jgi:hypothetical protein
MSLLTVLAVTVVSCVFDLTGATKLSGQESNKAPAARSPFSPIATAGEAFFVTAFMNNEQGKMSVYIQMGDSPLFCGSQ